MNWKSVIATHEEKQQLASGEWPGDRFPGVALPCRKALYRWIALRLGGRWTCAQVLDVGPWCVDDEAYVFGDAPPRAQVYKGAKCPYRIGDLETSATLPDGTKVEISNGAGIDLFPATAKALGIELNMNVKLDWKFVEI